MPTTPKPLEIKTGDEMKVHLRRLIIVQQAQYGWCEYGTNDFLTKMRLPGMRGDVAGASDVLRRFQAGVDAYYRECGEPGHEHLVADAIIAELEGGLRRAGGRL